MTELNYSTVSSLGTFFNKDSFEMLSPEQQETILAIGPDVMDFYGEGLEKADKNAIEVMSTGEDAIEFVKMSDADYAIMSEAGAPMIDKWKADADAVGTDGGALLNELYQLIDKWDQVMKDEGLPWNRG